MSAEDKPDLNGSPSLENRAELFGFTKKTNKLCCKGFCLVEIDENSKQLIISSSNKEFKTLEAQLSRKIIHQKNILCIFATVQSDNLVIVFQNDEICKKVFDDISIVKVSVSSRRSGIESTQHLFQEKFLLPAIYEIINSDKRSVDARLQSVVTNFLISSKPKEMEEYNKIFKEKKIYKKVVLILAEETPKTTNKENGNNSLFMNDSLNSEDGSQVKPSPRILSRKRGGIASSRPVKVKEEIVDVGLDDDNESDSEKHEDNDSDDDDEDTEDSDYSPVPSKKPRNSRHSIPPPTAETSIIRSPNYKVEQFTQNNIVKSKLIVFTDPPENTFCYEFDWDESKKRFICCGCRSKQKRTTATLDRDENQEYFVKPGEEIHICRIRRYNPKKFMNKQKIMKPGFEIIEETERRRERLLVFDADNRKLCFEYIRFFSEVRFCCRECLSQGRRVTAKLIENDDGDSYIQLNNVEHVCGLRAYDCSTKETIKSENSEPSSSKFKKIVKFPDFEIQNYLKNGESRKKLIIFNSADRNLCYQYYYRSQDDKYVCGFCQSKDKRVTAKLIKNSESEDSFVELGSIKHVCSLRPYSKENEIIMESDKFDFHEYSDRPSKLFIFASNDKKLCYIFSRTTAENKFRCLNCLKASQNRNSCYLTLCKRENGEIYLIQRNQQHCCIPEEYNPEKFEQKIIKSPDFMFYVETSKPKKLRIIILHPIDKDLCYIFQLARSDNSIKCHACYKFHKKMITGKICKTEENGEEYILLGNEIRGATHICEPINFEDVYTKDIQILPNSGLTITPEPNPLTKPNKISQIDENKIVKNGDFEFQTNDQGNPMLIIFHPNNRNLCYEYFYENYGKIFICNSCKSSKKRVSARVIGAASAENNDGSSSSYVKLGENEHICAPKKYVPEKDLIITENFMVFDDEKKASSKLLIFISEFHDMCYEFTQNQYGTYYCNGCKKMKAYLTAKVLQDEHGVNYVKVRKFQHICSPIPYVPKKSKTFPEQEFNATEDIREASSKQSENKKIVATKIIIKSEFQPHSEPC